MKIIDINTELSQNFIDFSQEANLNRAFADARDGLKPGQRACLWEMFIRGYHNNKPHVKSAKISGGVIANWWPHGDTAIYETFARMSQPWINNIPEVDWHGANGSIQISGDPAASRYTEARLSKATEEGLLYNVKKNTLMKSNFSEDAEWPEVFPALLPRLMINGCQGIGSTIANVWLPHSLQELANVINKYLTEGVLDFSELAPDFPTGGTIINKNALSAIYQTGKGKVVVRGTAEVKDNKILITEIPYQVYVEPLIEEIKNLVIKDEISGIDDILNKSDKKKMLIEITCTDNPASVLNQLYRLTDLQKSYSANQMALVGKTPKMLTLKDYLDVYIQHNYACIKRENEFELKKAQDRLNIVEGLIKALIHIDDIIALIKKSESAAKACVALSEVYGFNEAQSKAIVGMKLGSLARLEKVELEKEQQDLTSTIEICKDIIANEGRQKEIFLERFNKLVSKYATPRHTQLANIEIKPEEKEIEAVVPEDCVVILSQSGNIKRVPANSFKVQKKNGKGVKSEDDAVLDIISTNTVDTLMLFTDKGRMYKLLVDDIPSSTNAARGTYVNTFIKAENDEKVIAITSLYRETDAEYVIFITKKGLIKKTALTEYTSTKKKVGIIAIKLKEGDSLANVTFCKNEHFIIITKNGFCTRYPSNTIAPIGRATSGVKAITLAEDDEVVVGLPIHKYTDKLAVISTDGQGKKILIEDVPAQGRGCKGNKLGYTSVAGAALVSDEDNLLLIGTPNSICFSAKDIISCGRMAVGTSVIKNSTVKRIVKI